jgi:hypothetical protein
VDPHLHLVFLLRFDPEEETPTKSSPVYITPTPEAAVLLTGFISISTISVVDPYRPDP